MPTTPLLIESKYLSTGFPEEGFKNTHLRDHFRNGPAPCTICGKYFKKKSNYLEHYAIHFDHIKFTCTVCSEIFSSGRNLRRHRASIHKSLCIKKKPVIIPATTPQDENIQGKLFNCRFCPEKFPNKSVLIGHESIHTGKKVLQCSVCSRNFSKLTELDKHMRTHTGSKPFECPVCLKKFVQKAALNVHHAAVHSKAKIFQCSLCPQTFAYSSSYRRHLRNHKGETSFECQVISILIFWQKNAVWNTDDVHSYDTKHKGNLAERLEVSKRLPMVIGSYLEEAIKNVHVCVHFGRGTVPCKVCGKQFKSKQLYLKHYGFHAKKENKVTSIFEKYHKNPGTKSTSGEDLSSTSYDNKKYQCRFCLEEFFNRSDFIGHESVHTGKKVHHCSICLKNFGSQTELSKHLRIHTGSKPFECPVCRKTFAQKGAMKVHHVAVHLKAKSFQCTQCPQTFSYSSNFRKHMRIHRGFLEEAVKNVHACVHFGNGPVPCKVCGKQFKSKQLYLKHYGFHTEEENQLTSNSEKHHKNPDFLEEAVKNLHASVHFGKGSVPCKVCGKQFKSKKAYLKHYGIHTEAENRSTNNLEKHDEDPASTPGDNELTQEKYQCLFCPKKFLNRFSWLGHQRIHNGNKVHQCSVCLKNCATLGLLNKHLKIHDSESFECPVCSKKFVQKGAMHVHHVACKVCSKGFVLSSAMRNHEICHKETASFQCSICSKPFKYMYNLKKHESIQSKTLRCEICHRTFLKKETLARHLLTHSKPTIIA
ncbi:hypothetical protein JTB14_036786 [Gonioctena quinquepunctata]|nr:hypothetical protein JTB14_036786 [Gonioctena quinquepunctata]